MVQTNGGGVMGKFSTKTKDDNGNDAWEASDGRIFQTRAGAWKHSKALEAPEATKAEDVSPVDVSPSEPELTSWATMDFSGDTDDDTEVIPTIFKRINPGSMDDKKSKKQMEAERKTNLAVLGVAYKTGDHLMTRYKRGLLEDPHATAIKHTEQDYQWISGITNTALEENGIFLASAIGPSQVAVICNGFWFGSPLARIHKEAEVSPFKGRLGGGVGRMLERLPFIGSRLKKRREVKIPVLEDENDE